jgi:hypothetical protein
MHCGALAQLMYYYKRRIRLWLSATRMLNSDENQLLACLLTCGGNVYIHGNLSFVGLLTCGGNVQFS